MNEIDKMIRNHQQVLIATQAAKILQLEREKAEMEVRLKVANQRLAERTRGGAKKPEVVA